MGGSRKGEPHQPEPDRRTNLQAVHPFALHALVLAIAQGTDQGDDIEPELVLRQDEATLTLRPVGSAMVLTTRGLTAPDLQPQVDQTAERHHRALVVVAVAQPTSAA